jgi:hypothetical protein
LKTQRENSKSSEVLLLINLYKNMPLLSKLKNQSDSPFKNTFFQFFHFWERSANMRRLSSDDVKPVLYTQYYSKISNREKIYIYCDLAAGLSAVVEPIP